MQPTLQQWLSRTPAGPKPRKPLARSPIRKVSKRRQREGRAYRLLRAAFLQAHPLCMAWRHIAADYPESRLPALCPRSRDIHHKAGRHDGNYLNTDTWLAVSRGAHRWIHDHPKQARELGLLT